MTTLNKIATGLLLALLGLQAHAKTIELKVNGLVCAFCAQGIEKTLRAKSATNDVYVSLERGLVALTLNTGQTISEEELRSALTDAGYTVTEMKQSERTLAEIEAEAHTKAKAQSDE